MWQEIGRKMSRGRGKGVNQSVTGSNTPTPLDCQSQFSERSLFVGASGTPNKAFKLKWWQALPFTYLQPWI